VGNFKLCAKETSRVGPLCDVEIHTGDAHVKCVPCHHGMARPQVADGGDGLQIWRVAANILNKQWRTADRGCLPAWGLGGLTTLIVEKQFVNKYFTQPRKISDININLSNQYIA
jgi:hypothetical protein